MDWFPFPVTTESDTRNTVVTPGAVPLHEIEAPIFPNEDDVVPPDRSTDFCIAPVIDPDSNNVSPSVRTAPLAIVNETGDAMVRFPSIDKFPPDVVFVPLPVSVTLLYCDAGRV